MHLLEIRQIRVAPKTSIISSKKWVVEVNRYINLDYTWETYSRHASQEEAGEKMKSMREEIRRLKQYNKSLETWAV